MSNFEERLAARQAALDAALDDGIAAAGKAVSGNGSDACVECGRAIPAARRMVAPFATRCVGCQELIEAERYHR